MIYMYKFGGGLYLNILGFSHFTFEVYNILLSNELS